MKEIKEDLNEWRDMKCSLVEQLNIVKMSVLSKSICRIKIISVKIPARFLVHMRKIGCKIYGERQRN